MMNAMICKTATILSLAFAVPAHAAQEQERTVWNPPAEYDHPYQGHMTLFQVPQKQVVNLCKQLFANNGSDLKVTQKQRGCAWYVPGSCVVVTINREFRGTQPEDVVRHMNGVCNGWNSIEQPE